MILQASQIDFGYRHKTVLDDVNLTVNSGERVGLFAPSGRGKTTLCKLLAGYMQPKRGTVTLDGKPLSDYPGACPVQMIWQHPELALDPRIRLRQSLTEAGPIDQRLLDALHIQPAWLDRFPRELSGGELQRFCIARALAVPVKFLLCDEISAMLDLVTQAQLWQFCWKKHRRVTSDWSSSAITVRCSTICVRGLCLSKGKKTGMQHVFIAFVPAFGYHKSRRRD